LAAIELWSFCLKFLFIFDRTRHFCPSDWLLGVVIGRVTGEDMRAQMAREELAAKQRGFIMRAFGRFFGLLRTGLVASAILFKVVEWYYSPENQAQREAMEGPALLPPAPMPPTVLPGAASLLRDPRLCPLCHEPRKNPAISSSGVAFCFKCINKFATEHGQCPITGTPCAPDQIRRIFES